MFGYIRLVQSCFAAVCVIASHVAYYYHDNCANISHNFQSSVFHMNESGPQVYQNAREASFWVHVIWIGISISRCRRIQGSCPFNSCLEEGISARLTSMTDYTCWDSISYMTIKGADCLHCFPTGHTNQNLKLGANWMWIRLHIWWHIWAQTSIPFHCFQRMLECTFKWISPSPFWQNWSHVNAIFTLGWC